MTARESLEDVFAPTRASNLQGLLKPKERRPAKTGGTRTEDQPQAAEKPVPAPPTAAAPASAAGTSSPKNVTVYLPTATASALRQRAKSAELTLAEVVAQAFGGVSAEELRSALNPAEPQAPAGGMPVRAKRHPKGGGVQVQLRLDDAQRTWIDNKVDELDAPSRTALIAAVLSLHLGTPRT